MSRRPGIKRSDGAAVVEFAIVLPLLLLLLFGFLEFGRAMNYWLDTSHLANVGARWAAVNSNPGAPKRLQEFVRDEADTREMRSGGSSSVQAPAEVCITFPNGTWQVGDPVQARVRVDYNWMPFLAGKIGIARTTLSGTATMRLEAPPSAYGPGCTT
jgi:Flp pilus assembly protein TadG